MGSVISSLIVGIFNVIGKALAGAFLAELSLVQSFINNSHVVFGGNFGNLMHFNVIVIPGLALLVTLVWLVAKGLTGGNSKTSTEDIIKRVLGALVISLALSIIVGPVESLIGALDSSLMSLVNVNTHGLQQAFGGIATISAIGGIEDSIFISIVILFLGILIAGALIMILILAHAAVFLLVYFAPYFTLFRKDGFREMVEGVVAALSMPFIITSILAVGIATMGASGTTSVAGVVTTLSSSFGGHVVTQSIALASSKSISAVDYFSNAIGGLLILGAAVFMPKFLLGMIFQAGNAIHDAFRSGHQQLAGTAMNAASPTGSSGGKISGFLHKKLGGNNNGDNSSTPNGTGAYQNPSSTRSLLIDQAMEKNGKSSVVTVPPRSSDAPAPTSSAPKVDTTIPSSTQTSQQTDIIPAPSGENTPTESIPAVEPNPDLAAPTPLSAMDGSGPEPNPDPAPDGDPAPTPGSKGGLRRIVPTGAVNNAAKYAADHYKGTVKAIPNAISSMPRISVESPLHSGIEARAAWRAAKRESIQQVRETRVAKEKEASASLPAAPASSPKPPDPPDPPDTSPKSADAPKTPDAPSEPEAPDTSPKPPDAPSQPPVSKKDG